MKQFKKNLFAILIFIATNISVAQASVATYSVEGVFSEPNAYNTIFTGSFNWDGSLLSNLQGVMNSSMVFQEDAPNLSLSNNLITKMDGSVVTASIFLNENSVVFATGGYDATEEYMFTDTIGAAGVASVSNKSNAYFTFSFDTAMGSLSSTGVTTTMQYGDCTTAGMMGSFCMTAFGGATSGLNGRLLGDGTMSGFSSSLTISEVSAVPVPAAVWLFGSALLGMIGVSHRRTLSV